MTDISLWTPEFFKTNELACREFLKDLHNWRQIPLLNHAAFHKIGDSTLVRFRGMIQDNNESEIYLEKYTVKSKDTTRLQDGKYHDYLVVKADEEVDLFSPYNVHGDRRTMFVISVPGINTWTSEYEKNVCKQSTLQTNQEINKDEPPSGGHKRPAHEGDEMDCDESVESNENKRLKKETSGADRKNQQLLSREYLLNSPLNEANSKACMVKVYSDFDSLPINTIVDVVGFISVNPMLDGTAERIPDRENQIEYQAANPPPSLIPRLHAIAVNQLKHINPLLDISLMDVDDSRSNVEDTRKELLMVFTQCLFEDSISAEYLLSHLISTVYVRTETEALGQFSLNIFNIPKEILPEYTQALYEIIESLMPASHYFPMTLENMNKFQFKPKKNYQTNKLKSGLLQLAPHTHLVLDETRLQPGKLDVNGVLNLQSLAYLIKTQQFKCNFEFYELDFNTNIPVLILSEGKSILPSNCHIPLKSKPQCVELIMETIKAAKHYLQPKLNIFRKYLTTVRIQKFNMDSSSSEMVQNDFVEMRKSDKKIGADHLHSLLVFSRLLAIVRGKNTLDKESWERAKVLESERWRQIDENKRK